MENFILSKISNRMLVILLKINSFILLLIDVALDHANVTEKPWQMIQKTPKEGFIFSKLADQQEANRQLEVQSHWCKYKSKEWDSLQIIKYFKIFPCQP